MTPGSRELLFLNAANSPAAIGSASLTMTFPRGSVGHLLRQRNNSNGLSKEDACGKEIIESKRETRCLLPDPEEKVATEGLPWTRQFRGKASGHQATAMSQSLTDVFVQEANTPDS